MNKIVLITGGTSDLGKAIIEEYAANDYDIIFTYHNHLDIAQSIRNDIRNKYSINIEYEYLDLLEEQSILNLSNKINHLDVLVNNAAYNNDECWYNKTYAEYDKIVKTNLIGPFVLVKELASKLSNGVIVNVASTNGIDTMYTSSLDYDASKAGLINMTKNLASAMAPIRVNAVAPGWIDTSNVKDMEPKIKDAEISKIALGRFANPAEIANVIYFLTSEKASYINGTVIIIDGGRKYEL